MDPPSDPAQLAEWVMGLSAKELKAFIVSRGLQHTDCFEKADFQARAIEAAKRQPSQPTASKTPEKMDVSKLTLAGYDCLTVGPRGDDADMVLIMLHGFGASSTDFVPFAEALSRSQHLAGLRVLYVLPQAPGFPPQWWELDVFEFAMAQHSADGMARIVRRVPPGLDVARERLMRLVDEARVVAGNLPPSKVVLGGFSQGAMTAADLALAHAAEGRVGGVCMVSGAPMVVEEWAERAKHHKGLPVLITHGVNDSVLPFVASGWARDLLTMHGLAVEYETHGGGHELGDARIQDRIAEFIAKCGRVEQ